MDAGAVGEDRASKPFPATSLTFQRGYFGPLEQLAPGQELKANVNLRSPSSIG
jgi:hypothetical protein